MRALLYIPILHTEADLGSAAPALRAQTITLCGAGRWAEHCEAVCRFWDRLAEYFDRLDAKGLRLYQDGLGVGGDAGLRIVRKAAERGSPNYRLLLGLIQRGAVLQATEHPALLGEEQQTLLSGLGVAKPGAKVGDASPQPREDQERRGWLLSARDRFIGETIHGTLQEGETAALFMGAYHDVRPYLAPDIVVRELKALLLVRQYFQALFIRGSEPWQSLAKCLTTPIPTPVEGRPGRAERHGQGGC
ncbi:MAG: hypothetical protein HY688_00885 [Chloroflexi bacterium]|nr:hypothetical protein [Chloroflexota bacterium]